MLYYGAYLLGHNLIHDRCLAGIIEPHYEYLARLRAHAQRAEKPLEKPHPVGTNADPQGARLGAALAPRPASPRCTRSRLTAPPSGATTAIASARALEPY